MLKYVPCPTRIVGEYTQHLNVSSTLHSLPHFSQHQKAIHPKAQQSVFTLEMLKEHCECVG